MTRATLRTLRARATVCGWRAVALRALVLAAGWWILTEGGPTVPVFGALVVLVALIAGLALPSPPPPAWRLLGLLRFAFVFVIRSVRGGVDVAWRALSPRVRIAPSVMEYSLRLPDGAARNLFLGTLSSMPGTLAVACEGQRLELHVIAARREIADELAALEASIADAAGERLEESRA